MVLGIAAARFLKASSRDRYRQRTDTTRTSGLSVPDQSLAPAVPPSEQPNGVITPGQSAAPVSPGVAP